MSQLADWRDPAGFEGRYQVARPERVRSVDRYVPQGSRWKHPVMKLHRGRELKPYICKNGRKRVILHVDGDRHCRYVDDLVREAFGTEAPANNGHPSSKPWRLPNKR